MTEERRGCAGRITVEVPQHGIVRSLNVHVTGALVVWEYVRQHSHSAPPPQPPSR